MNNRPDGSYEPQSAQEEQFLRSYDPSRYPRAEVTADTVLLTIRDGELCVLLVRRSGFPYQHHWALPGGFVGPDETLEQAARRELAEETGLDSQSWHLEQLGTYGDPGRDPRARVISVAYVGFLPDIDAPQAGSDAADARFWPVEALTDESVPLAFDHDRILADGLERAASKLEYTPLATAFCQPEFTIHDLHRVFETVWRVPVDKRNFRRWVLSRPGFVVATDEHATTAGRPALLYRSGDANLLHPPMLRPSVKRQLGALDGEQP